MSTKKRYSIRKKADHDDLQLLQALAEGIDKHKQFAPAVKVVIDRKLEESFEDILSKYTRKKDIEIREVCNSNYEDFDACISSIVGMEADMTNLQDEVVRLNDGVQKSGASVIKKVEELEKYKKIRENLDETQESISNSLYFVEKLSRSVELVNAGKFFQAIHIIQNLQLSFVVNNAISTAIYRKIPLILFAIRHNVKLMYDQWLLQASAKSEDLGAVAMVCMSEILAEEEKNEKRRRSKRLKGIGGSIDATNMYKTLDSGLQISRFSEELLNENDLFEKINIDLSTVYQCYHLYEHLDAVNQFVSYYKDSRKIMVNQAVERRDITRDNFLEECQGYFAKITGFFLIEEGLQRSGNPLFERYEVDELWELSLSKVKVMLSEQIGFIADPEDFLNVKVNLVLFCRTLQSFGFQIISLLEFMESFREKFEELLTQKLQEDISDVMLDEKYEPLIVSSVREYEKYILTYRLQNGLESSGLNQGLTSRTLSPSAYRYEEKSYSEIIQKPGTRGGVMFPLTVPFSITVPRVTKLVKRFIHDYYLFSRNLVSTDLHIRKVLDEVLCKVVDSSLNSVLDTATDKIIISQAAQISMNATFFIHACDYFESYVASHVNPKTIKDLEAFNKLYARSVFNRTKQSSEDLVFELMNSKIEKFIADFVVSFDWLPNKENVRCSPYIDDMLPYMETTFSCLSFLPSHIIQGLNFITCKHIVEILFNELMNCKRYNIIAIYNLNLDVMMFEEYARNSHVDNLIDVFAELSQFIHLILSGNIGQIIDKPTRDTKYPYISIKKLIFLLEKYRDTGILAKVPESLGKIVKKKTVDNIIKKLKLMDK